MHRIDPNRNPDGLTALKEKALKWTQDLLDAYEKGPASVDVGEHYKQFRSQLEETHHGNCCYCEMKVRGHPGDVEHYRPKGRVKEKGPDGKIVTVDHPGYFWEANSWENLLFSCIHCNRASNQKMVDGTAKAGKQDRFDISGTRATKPGDSLEDENPKLVHPMLDEPTDHLILDEDIAYKALDERGAYTIELFRLNSRGELVDDRLEAYKKGRSLVFELVDGIKTGSKSYKRDCAESLEKIAEGSVSLASAHLYGVFAGIKELEAGLFGSEHAIDLNYIISKARE